MFLETTSPGIFSGTYYFGRILRSWLKGIQSLVQSLAKACRFNVAYFLDFRPEFNEKGVYFGDFILEILQNPLL